MKLKLSIFFVLFMIAFGLQAQDFLELAKHDLNSEKRSIVAKSINIPQDADAQFWNTYNDMEAELNVLVDKRIAIIKKFAKNYATLDNDIAGELISTYFSIISQRNKINQKYFKKMSKVISKKEAARFSQIMAQIQLLIDVQLAAEVPLIE